MTKKPQGAGASVQNDGGAFALDVATGADTAPTGEGASRRVATRRSKKDDDAVASVALADSGTDRGAQGEQTSNTAPVVADTAPFSYVFDAGAISIDLNATFMDADVGQTLTYTIASFDDDGSSHTPVAVPIFELAEVLSMTGLSFAAGMWAGTLASKANYAITMRATDSHATDPKFVEHTFSLTASDFYDFSTVDAITGSTGTDRFTADEIDATTGNIFYLNKEDDSVAALSNEGAGLVDTIIVRGNLTSSDFSYDDITSNSVESYGTASGNRNFELGVDRLVFVVTEIDADDSTPLTDAHKNTILGDFTFRLNRGTNNNDGRVTLEITIMEAAQSTTLRLHDARVADEIATFANIAATNSAASNGFVTLTNNADILDLFGVSNFAIVHHSVFEAPNTAPESVADAPFSYAQAAGAISIDLSASFLDADADQTLTYEIVSFDADGSDSTAAATESAALTMALTDAGLSFDGTTGLLTGTLASKANYAITVRASDDHATDPKFVDHTFSLTENDFYDYSSQSGIVGSTEADTIAADDANDASGNIFYLRESADSVEALSNETGIVDTIIVRLRLGTDARGVDAISFVHDETKVNPGEVGKFTSMAEETYGTVLSASDDATANHRNFELGVDRLVFVVTSIDDDDNMTDDAMVDITDAHRNTILDLFQIAFHRSSTTDDGRVSLNLFDNSDYGLALNDALIANEEAAFANITAEAGNLGFSRITDNADALNLFGVGNFAIVHHSDFVAPNPVPLAKSDADIAALATSGSALETFITALADMVKAGGDVVVSTATLAMLFTNLDDSGDMTTIYSFAIGDTALTATEAGGMVTITIPALAERDVGSISISASDNGGDANSVGEVKFAIGGQYDFSTDFVFRKGSPAPELIVLVDPPEKNVTYYRGGAESYVLTADTFEDVILLDASVQTPDAAGTTELSLLIDDIPAGSREFLENFQAGTDRIVFRVRSIDGDPTASLTEAQIEDYFNLLTFTVTTGRNDTVGRNDNRDGLNIVINIGNPGGTSIQRGLSFGDFFSAFKTNAANRASVATDGTDAENRASIEALFGGARYFSFVGNADIMLPASANDAPEFVATAEETVFAGVIGIDIADIDINDLFKDFDNDAITYTIKSVNGTLVTAISGEHEFNGITFTEATGIFSTEPAGPTVADTHVVVITASDGTLEVDGEITIKIRGHLGAVAPEPAEPTPIGDLTVDNALAHQGKSGGFVYADRAETNDDIRFYIALGGAPASGVTDTREFVLIDASGFIFRGEWGTIRLGEPTTDGILTWLYIAKAHAHTAARSEVFTVRTTDGRVIDHNDDTTYVSPEQYITIGLAESTSTILTNIPEGTEIVVPLVPAASDTGKKSDAGYKITGDDEADAAQIIIADQAPDVLIASVHGDRIDAGRGIDKIKLAAEMAVDTVYYTIGVKEIGVEKDISWIAYDGADTIENFERGVDKLVFTLRVSGEVAEAGEAYYNNNAGDNVDLRPIYSADGMMVAGIELGFGVSGSSYGGISTGNVLTINFAAALATADYAALAAMGLAEVLGSTETGAMDVFDVNFEFVAANNAAEVARGSGFIDALAVARVGVDISVDLEQISDADGLSEARADEANNFSYQWVRLDSVGLGVDIASFALMDDSGFGGSGVGGARVDGTDADGVYTPDAVNIGDFIRVIVSFRDDAGNAESVSSDAVRIIPALDDAPPPLDML